MGDWEAAAPLLSALGGASEPAARAAAARSLGEIGDGRALSALARALDDADASVRTAAVDAIGEIGDQRALRALTAAGRDPEAEVQAHAMIAMCKLGDADTVRKIKMWMVLEGSEPAARMLEIAAHPDSVRELLLLVEATTKPGLRAAAIDALGAAADPKALSALIAALGASEPGVRMAAARALAKIGADRAIGPLNAALDDEDPRVREAAAVALDDLGCDPVDARHTALIDAARKGEAQPPPELGQPLAGDSDASARAAAVRALTGVSDETMASLASLLFNDDQLVAKWKDGVVAQSSSNWLLCPSCTGRARQYSPS